MRACVQGQIRKHPQWRYDAHKHFTDAWNHWHSFKTISLGMQHGQHLAPEFFPRKELRKHSHWQRVRLVHFSSNLTLVIKNQRIKQRICPDESLSVRCGVHACLFVQNKLSECMVRIMRSFLAVRQSSHVFTIGCQPIKSCTHRELSANQIMRSLLTVCQANYAFIVVCWPITR